MGAHHRARPALNIKLADLLRLLVAIAKVVVEKNAQLELHIEMQQCVALCAACIDEAGYKATR